MSTIPLKKGIWSKSASDWASWLVVPSGERLVIEMPGGGGMGNPADRDPEAVRRDIEAIGAHRGVRISETPVDWTDDPNSSVDILHTALDDLRGIWRIARDRRLAQARPRALVPQSLPGPSPATADQLLSFAGVGVLSTLSYLLLFAAGWSALGPWLANAAALAFCTLVNTALHRSLACRSPGGATSLAGQTSLVTIIAVLYGVSLVATTAAIAVANAVAGPSLAGDALAATIASCAAALLRFSLLRGWAFRPQVAASAWSAVTTPAPSR